MQLARRITLSMVIRTLVCFLVLLSGRWLLMKTSGVALFLSGLLLLACCAMLARDALKAIGRDSAGVMRWWARATMLAASTLVVFAMFEGFLHLQKALSERALRKAPKSSASALAIPEEWKERIVEIPGTKRAHYWHGKLHVFNMDRMRHVGPYPAKDPKIFRIIAVGDSLTYGQGVGEEETYPRVIENALKKQYRAEVLNLGVCGDQSEDVLDKIRTFVPALKPNLVVYGVCTNDFLPSGITENDTRWSIPVPPRVKNFLVAKTLTFQVLSKTYVDLLVATGVRPNFVADVLKDYNSYQKRFAKDVRAMNEYVVGQGLPPIVTMVLDQCPQTPSARYSVDLAAEKYLKQAGMKVVSCVGYIRKYNKKDLYVSKWEGHPNAEAHRIFAQKFSRSSGNLC